MNYICGSIDSEAQTENMTALMWTTTPPTEEGYYFVKHSQYTDPPVFMVEVDREGDGFVYWEFSTDEMFDDLSKIAYWLGPLPLPEPPKEGE